jgi:uncharacterized protein YaaW (UPF0174 family)
MSHLREDHDLIELLTSASVEDLGILVDYITNCGKGRISLDNEVMSKLIAAKATKSFSDADRQLIASEIQLFGGNTLVNLMRRGKGVLYREILDDVADHLKVERHKSDSAVAVEKGILMCVAARAWERMSSSEKNELAMSLGIGNLGPGAAALAAVLAAIQSAGVASYRFAAFAAQSIANQVLGRGVAFGAAFAPVQRSGAMLGPIGLAITGVWTIADMASPAYRVTVPCVIQLAYMRQKQQSRACAKCLTANHAKAKFCSQCGEKLMVEEKA